jgi:hypothetical protein
MAYNWRATVGDRVINHAEFRATGRTFPGGTEWIVAFEPTPYDSQIVLSKADEPTYIRLGIREWELFTRHGGAA